MKKLFFIALFIAMSLLCIEAKGADWKYYGAAKVPPENEPVIAFYDAESLEHLSNGNVRVWSKTITKTVFDMCFRY